MTIEEVRGGMSPRQGFNPWKTSSNLPQNIWPPDVLHIQRIGSLSKFWVQLCANGIREPCHGVVIRLLVNHVLVTYLLEFSSLV